MPQLDLATYPGIILFVTVFFFGFFLLLIHFFLPTVLAKFLSVQKINMSYDEIQNTLHRFSLFFFLEKYTCSFVLNACSLDAFHLLNQSLSLDDLDFVSFFGNYVFCEDVLDVDLLRI